ncbi:hypothetical protein Tco_0149697 [Tanacetum coccineum]
MSAHEDEDASDGRSMGSMRILDVIKAKTEVPKFVGKGLQYMQATINGVKVRALVDSDAKIGAWMGQLIYRLVPMVDSNVVLGLEDLNKGGGSYHQVGDGSKPLAKAPYHMPPPKLEELHKQLKELMDAGYIQPSKALYGAPMLFQKKKDGFSLINLKAEELFSKLDLRWVGSLPSMDIADGDEAKTTPDEVELWDTKFKGTNGLMMDGGKVIGYPR